MQPDVDVPAWGLARAPNTLLDHCDLTVAIHFLGEFPHSNDALDDPGSTRSQLLQPSLLLAMSAKLPQGRGKRPEDGADLDLVGPLLAIRG